MKKAWLILRLPIETAFGLLYMTSLLLLPNTFKMYGPLFGYLGMPRGHLDGSMLSQAEIRHINYIGTLVNLLIITFLCLNGILWFKDVYSIIQKLRTKTT